MSEDELRLREAMLNAIFDRPIDESRRLIFADWLEERGEVDFATLLRNERIPHDLTDSLSIFTGSHDRHRHEIMDRNLPGFSIRICEDVYPGSSFKYLQPTAVFREGNTVRSTVDVLSDHAALRIRSVSIEPTLFLTTKIIVNGGFISNSSLFDAIHRCPAFKQVCQLNLSANIQPANSAQKTAGELVPLIGLEGIRAFSNHRLAGRIKYLGLSYNQLNDEAAQALIDSPHIRNLNHLSISMGNRISIKTTRQLQDRFRIHYLI